MGRLARCLICSSAPYGHAVTNEIGRLRDDIEVLARAHWAPKGRLDKTLTLLLAMLEEHERMNDLGMERDHTWKEVERLIREY